MKQPTERKRPIWWIVVIAMLGCAGICWWFFSPEKKPVVIGQGEQTESVQPVGIPASSQAKAARSEVVPSAASSQVVAVPVVRPVRSEGKDVAKPVDGVVQPRFIEDLAKFFVNGYHPTKNGSGSIGVGVQEANMRYGMRMVGLKHRGKDVAKGRRFILNSVFTSSMVQWFYDIYADRFMTAVGQRVDQASFSGVKWSSRMKMDFYKQYAIQLLQLADTFKGISTMSASILSIDLKRIHSLGDDVVVAENKYSEAMFAVEQAREKGRSDTKNVERRHAAIAAKKYQNAVIARETARHALCSRIAAGAGAKILPDDTVLFVAQWVERRVRTNPSQFGAVKVVAQRIGDLAARFDLASRRWSR